MKITALEYMERYRERLRLRRGFLLSALASRETIIAERSVDNRTKTKE